MRPCKRECAARQKKDFILDLNSKDREGGPEKHAESAGSSSYGGKVKNGIDAQGFGTR